MTPKTKDYCQMCGARQGEKHHDETYAFLIVELVEHRNPKRQDEMQLLCQPCLQGTEEIELEASGTPEGLLAKAARLQDEFWDALGELEAELGFDVDGARELAGVTVEDLREGHEEDDDEEGDDEEGDDEEKDPE